MASKGEAAFLGLNACVKGHVGDGNFHENITYDGTKQEEFEKVKLAVKNMVKRAIETEGTCTGEHGIGFGKKEALQQELGDQTMLFMVCFLFGNLGRSSRNLLTPGIMHRKFSRQLLIPTGLCMIAIRDILMQYER